MDELRKSYGELVPLGGGDTIPLLKKSLLIGRRESCDIVLRFPNVSAHHCQLTINGGYWYARDLQSRNGIKVNSVRVSEKRLDPGDQLSVAKHSYEVRYSPVDLGATGPPPNDDLSSNIFNRSLLERAGLSPTRRSSAMGKKSTPPPAAARDSGDGRYDLLNDGPGQIKDPNRPL